MSTNMARTSKSGGQNGGRLKPPDFRSRKCGMPGQDLQTPVQTDQMVMKPCNFTRLQTSPTVPLRQTGHAIEQL